MATSKIPTDKLTIDSTIVGILNFPAFFALQMPHIPKGMPAKNIIVLPHNPIISNKPNRKLEFKMFLTGKEINIQNDEFLLPNVIGSLIKQKKCTVDLLESSSTWYGITYSQDKEYVVSSLKKLVSEGKYKKGLW